MTRGQYGGSRCYLDPDVPNGETVAVAGASIEDLVSGSRLCHERIDLVEHALVERNVGARSQSSTCSGFLAPQIAPVTPSV